MYKNKLKELMLERNISNHKLAKETTISRRSISKIKNNEFHDISINILTELLIYFNVSFDEFGMIHTREECLQSMLSNKGFNQQNLDLLESLLSKNLHISCKYHPYSQQQCLNIYSKKYFKKFSFSGNIRINTSLDGLTFEIIDFDLYKTSEDFDFYDFYHFYKKFIAQFEQYALKLGFTQIVINVNSYIDKNLQTFIAPRAVNLKDLNFLVNNSTYSDRENNLIKTSIIKQLNYKEYSYHESHKRRIAKHEEINDTIDSLTNLTFFEKEQKRLDRFSKEKISLNYDTKKFIKELNPEVVPKYKLEQEFERRWR